MFAHDIKPNFPVVWGVLRMILSSLILSEGLREEEKEEEPDSLQKNWLVYGVLCGVHLTLQDQRRKSGTFCLLLSLSVWSLNLSRFEECCSVSAFRSLALCIFFNVFGLTDFGTNAVHYSRR